MKSCFRTGYFLSLLWSILLPLGAGLTTWLFPEHGVKAIWTIFMLVGFKAGLRMFRRRNLERNPRKVLFLLAPAVIPMMIGLVPAADWGMSAFPEHSRAIAIAVYGLMIPLAAGSYLFFSLKATLAVLRHNPRCPEREGQRR